MKLKKNAKKDKKIEIAIKIMKTKFDIKIIWNQMLRDEIKNKFNKKNDKKTTIKRMRIKLKKIKSNDEGWDWLKKR